jgi:hypothetical protein
MSHLRCSSGTVLYPDEDTIALPPGSRIIFTRPEFLGSMQERLLPHLTSRFTLVTGMSDESITADNSRSLLDLPHLHAWFAVNKSYKHPKLKSLPIGLESKIFQRTETDVMEAAWKRTCEEDKTELLFFGFGSTHPSRENARRMLTQNGFKESPLMAWPEYISLLSSCRFCASPRGNGIDCHRTWEAILCRCIPILEENESSHVIELLQDGDVPMLVVQDLGKVNHQLLEDAWERLRIPLFARSQYPDQLSGSYWKSVIRNTAWP